MKKMYSYMCGTVRVAELVNMMRRMKRAFETLSFFLSFSFSSLSYYYYYLVENNTLYQIII